MIASIDRKTILPAFLRGAEAEFKSALGGKRPTEYRIQGRFGITGLFNAMYTSAHFSEWRAVGIEARPPIRTVPADIGFDFLIGPRDGANIQMRYFPQVKNPRDKSFPLEIARLKVALITDGVEDQRSLYNIPAIFTECRVNRRSVLFGGEIPVRGRTFTTLRIYPVSDTSGGYTFQLK